MPANNPDNQSMNTFDVILPDYFFEAYIPESIGDYMMIYGRVCLAYANDHGLINNVMTTICGHLDIIIENWMRYFKKVSKFVQ